MSAVPATQKLLVYTLLVAGCCLGGLQIWTVFTNPLSDFVPKQPAIDNSTFANIDEIFTFHFHMDVEVDFDGKSIGGSIIHDMNTVALTDKVVLDIWDMDIESVEYMRGNSAQWAREGNDPESLGKLDFKVYEINPVIGQTLAI